MPQIASHRSVNILPVCRVAHRAGGKNKNLLRAVGTGTPRQFSDCFHRRLHALFSQFSPDPAGKQARSPAFAARVDKLSVLPARNQQADRV